MTFLKIADPDKPGDYLVLASDQFDPSRHALFAVAEAAAAPEPPKLQTIVEGNVDAAKALVTAAPDLATLDQLAADEAANKKTPGGRASVMAAIQARRTALVNVAL